MSDSSKVSPIRLLFGRRLPVLLYCLVGAALLAQGVRYIGATAFMPYHSAVIATPWDGLSQSHQTLTLGLLKGFGAGSFCVGLAIILMTLIPFRAGCSWSRWAIPAVAATYTGGLVYVTKFALLPGATPIAVSLTLLGCVVVASVSSFLGVSDGG